MIKSKSLLILIFFLANSFAWAAADRSDDLTYCLDLPTAQQIAKCSGEISASKRGRIFSKQEVEKILSMEKSIAPTSASDISGMPAAVNEQPNTDVLPEKSDSDSN